MVEHRLPKPGAEGSNPFSRSSILGTFKDIEGAFFMALTATLTATQSVNARTKEYIVADANPPLPSFDQFQIAFYKNV